MQFSENSNTLKMPLYLVFKLVNQLRISLFQSLNLALTCNFMVQIRDLAIVIIAIEFF